MQANIDIQRNEINQLKRKVKYLSVSGELEATSE